MKTMKCDFDNFERDSRIETERKSTMFKNILGKIVSFLVLLICKYIARQILKGIPNCQF